MNFRIESDTLSHTNPTLILPLGFVTGAVSFIASPFF
jgi:hypothetical protein